MTDFLKKRKKFFICLFSLTFIITLFLLGKFFVSAQEGVTLFPGIVSGNWENKEQALQKNLGPEASFEDFNFENSAFPFFYNQAEENLPKTSFFGKFLLFTKKLFKSNEALAEDSVASPISSVLETPINTTTPEQTITEIPVPTETPIPTTTEISTPTPTLTSTETVIPTESIMPTESSTPPETIEPLPSTIETETPIPTPKPEPIEIIEPTQTQEPILAEPIEKTLELSSFNIPKQALKKKIKNVSLKLSLAGRGATENDKFIISYQKTDLNEGEVILDEIIFHKEIDNATSFLNISNASKEGYWEYNLSGIETWEELKKIRVFFKFQSVESKEKALIYLDSAWIDVEVQETKKIDVKDEQPVFLDRKSFQWTENPEFKLTKKTGFYGLVVSDSTTINSEDRKNKEFLDGVSTKLGDNKTSIYITDPRQEVFTKGINIENDTIKILHGDQGEFRPGLYKLKIKTEIDGKEVIQERDFSWGVLAINTNKSIYNPGETAYLQMASLTEYGHTVCYTPLKLEVENPNGQIDVFTTDPEANRTDDNTILYSDTCGFDNITDNPDYYVFYKTNAVGKYKLKLTNLNNNFEVTNNFEVRESNAFQVERIRATRINPFQSNYIMTLRVIANQDFSGSLRERVPANFEIIENENYRIKSYPDYKEIIWNFNLLRDEQKILTYEYNAPDISPQLYLLGPLVMKEGKNIVFQSVNQWQLAADASCLSTATGNWSSISWTNCASGPQSTDTVTIQNGHVVTMDADKTIAGLTITGTSTNTTLTGTGYGLIINGTVTINQPTTSSRSSTWLMNTGTATVSGLITLAGTNTTNTRDSDITITSGTLQASGGITCAGTAANTKDITISSTGGIGMKGSITNTACTLAPGTSSWWNYNDTADQTIDLTWGAGNYYHLYTNNTGTNGASLPAAVTSTNVGGNLKVQSGTLLNATYPITGGSGDTFEVSNGATFTMTGSATFPGSFSTFTFGATSTVNYYQNAAATISAQTYGHLNLKPSANSITFTFQAGSPVVQGNLATGVNGAYTGAIITAATNSTILDVNGNVTIGANSTLTAHASNAFTVGGDWTNSGTFTHSGGTVTFDSTSTGKNINAGSSSFANVYFNGSGGGWTALTNTFAATGTLEVNAGNFDLGAVAVTITGTTSATGTLTFSSATGNKNFTGAVTLNSGAVWNETGAATMTLAGDFTNNATTFTASTGIHTFSGTSKTLSGSTITAIPNTAVNGTVTNNGTLTVSTALSGSGTLTNGATGTLNLGGTVTVSTLTTTTSGNTVNYNGSAEQTILGQTYHHLQYTGSSTGSLGAATIVNGDLTIGGSGRINTTTNNYQLTLNGSFTNSGTFTANASPIVIGGTSANPTIAGFTTTGAVSFTRTASTATLTGDITGASLTINGSGGTLNLGNTMSHVINGAVLISNGTLISGDNTQIDVYGDWTNNATFTAVTGSLVWFKGSSVQTISGTATPSSPFESLYTTASATTKLGSAIIVNLNFYIGATSTFDTSTSNHQITFKGDFLSDGGLLVANGSNIIIDGTAAVPGIKGFTTTGNVSCTKTSGTATFTGDINAGSLTVNGSGGTLNLGTSLSHTISGAVLISAGTLNASSSTIAVTGNWTNNATFTASTSTVNLTGTSEQTLSGTLTGAGKFNTLSYTGSSTANLGANLEVGGDLTIGASGRINTSTSNYTVTLDSSFTNSGTFTANASPIVIAGSDDVAKSIGAISTTGAVSFTRTANTATLTGNLQGASLTINGTGGTLNLGASRSHTITGAVLISNGTLNGGSGTTILYVGGNWTNNATFTAGTSTVQAYSSGEQTLSGTLTGAGKFYKLYITASGTAKLGANVEIDNTFYIISGNFYTSASNYSVTINGTYSSIPGTFNGSGSQIIIAGTATANFAGLTTTGNINFTRTSGTTTFTGDINAGSLTINGSGGTLNLGSEIITTISGSVLISNGILDAGSTNDFYVGGDWTNNATFTAGTTTTVYFNGSSTQTISGTLTGTTGKFRVLRYTGSGTATFNNDFYTVTLVVNGTGTLDFGTEHSHTIASGTTITAGLLDTNSSTASFTTINNSGTINFGSSNIAMSNQLTNNNGATINAESSYMTTTGIGSAWTNNGAFNAGSGTVKFNGSNSQILAGTLSGTYPFYNLVITNTYGTLDPGCGTSFTPGVTFSSAVTATNSFTITGAAKIQFLSGATYTFTNINWNGGGSDMQLRNSNLSSGTWLLNVTGTQTVSDVDVARSDATPGDVIKAYDGTNTNCNDNTDWLFSKIISVTLDPNEVYYGFLALSSTKTTEELLQEVVITNNGTVTENMSAISSDATGGTTWQLSLVQDDDEFTHEFCAETSCTVSWTSFNVDNSTYETVTTGLTASSTKPLYLKIGMPQNTTDYVQKSITITVLAEETP